MFLGGAVAHLFHSYVVFYCMNTSQLIYPLPNDGHLNFSLLVYEKQLLRNMPSGGHVHSSVGYIRDSRTAESGVGMHLAFIDIAKQFPKVLEPLSTPTSNI